MQLFFIYLIFFFNACQKNYNLSSLPKTDNKRYIGIGQGTSISQAQSRALTDITYQIHSTVQSNTKDISSGNSLGYNSSYTTQDLSMNSKEITINNYEVIKNDKINSQEYMSVLGVEKSTLSEQLKMKVERTFSEIDYENFKNLSALERKKKSKQITKDLNDIEDYINIIYSINPSYEYKEKYQQIQKIKKDIYEIISKIIIQVSSEDKKLQHYIEKELTNIDLKITNNYIESSNYINLIASNVEINEKEVMGTKGCKINAAISLFDNKNQKISSYNASGYANSITSSNIACNNAYYELSSELIKEIFEEKN